MSELTHDEICSMDAQQLRIEIAVLHGYVWTVHEIGFPNAKIYDLALGTPRNQDRKVVDGPDNDSINFYCPDWSRSMTDAWSLVGEMSLAPNTEVYLYVGDVDVRVTVCETYKRKDGRVAHSNNGVREICSAVDENVKIAICRAYLHWMKIGMETIK